MIDSSKMTFFCVYCKTRKKFDKFIAQLVSVLRLNETISQFAN